MIYPRCYKFKTQTLQRTPDKQGSEFDIAKTWEMAQIAYQISPVFPPIVYTFYDEFIEFISYEGFLSINGFDSAVQFLVQQVAYNAAMKGGAIVFHSLDAVSGFGCLYFWKGRPSMLRVAKDPQHPNSFNDYIYAEGKYRAAYEEINAYSWFPWLKTKEKPLVSAKNKLGTDHRKLLNYFWKIAAHAVKQVQGRPVLTPTIACIYNDIIDVFDLSPYTYSSLAGLGLASFVNAVCQPEIIASAVTLVEQEDNNTHFLVLRYSINGIYIIRSSKLTTGSLSYGVTLAPFEENVAHAQSSQ